jgi:hypothetical protein
MRVQSFVGGTHMRRRSRAVFPSESNEAMRWRLKGVRSSRLRARICIGAPADDDAAAAVSACDAARAGAEPSAALPGVEESECSDLR